MAMGADLVADDQTILTRRDAQLFARSPAALAGLIEARGLGILRAPPLSEAEIVLVVDLSQTESDRLPPSRKIALLEVPLDLVLGSQSNHFPASVLCYLRYGRQD